jgi:NAD-dependent dihydropyrimidine dehydrogenase PreA subunit
MAIVIDGGTCTACGSCIDTCPLELIALGATVAEIDDPDSCIECGACVDSCPTESIIL